MPLKSFEAFHARVLDDWKLQNHYVFGWIKQWKIVNDSVSHALGITLIYYHIRLLCSSISVKYHHQGSGLKLVWNEEV